MGYDLVDVVSLGWFDRGEKGSHVNGVYDDVLHAGVFEILAQAADGHAVSSVAGGVLHKDVVGAGFDGDAVVASLVDEVGQADVLGVHGVWTASAESLLGWVMRGRPILEEGQLTELISILNPIFSIRRLRSRGITIQLIKPHISPVHDVATPQWGLFDEELLDRHVRDVPEDKRHRSSGKSRPCFGGVPGISIAVDSSSAVAVDENVVACYDE